MSKGMGTRQRALLDALQPGRIVCLREIAPDDDAYRAMLRAAQGLADAGRLRLVHGAHGIGAALPDDVRRHGDAAPAEPSGPDWRTWVYGGVKGPR